MPVAALSNLNSFSAAQIPFNSPYHCDNLAKLNKTWVLLSEDEMGFIYSTSSLDFTLCFFVELALPFIFLRQGFQTCGDFIHPHWLPTVSYILLNLLHLNSSH